ncbi:MAG TPA: baseplate J/gp47 family protein [Roseomonas sp.]|nr:baseplate J/gp47 family protein [Roseomonas sp.]
MTVPPTPRPGQAADLTRWNRAGLRRFRYVDGDAAVWLEELRIAMLGLFMRGGPPELMPLRLPEYWRDLFMKPVSEWPDEAERRLVATWSDTEAFLPAYPPAPESAGRRNARLLDQYARRSDDYAWEIMRAFARAAHVLLGHADAFANEGYLRTATQWDNIRKLAALVNYQPTPPASAVTLVALLVEGVAGPVEVERGLAMRYTPAAGGAPLIFETLRAVQAHPALNAARASGWNRNERPLKFDAPGLWALPAKAKLAVGDLAVLVSAGPEAKAGTALRIASLAAGPAPETALLGLDPAEKPALALADAMLLTEPRARRTGTPRSGDGTLVVEVDQAGGFIRDAVVQVHAAGKVFQAVVVSGEDRVLRLATTETLPTGPVSVEPLSAIDAPAGVVSTMANVSQVFFRSGTPGQPPIAVSRYEDQKAEDKFVARRFTGTVNSVGAGFVAFEHGPRHAGQVVGAAPEVVPRSGEGSGNTVRFAGSPPTGLAQGDWFVASPLDGGASFALQARGVLVRAGAYFVEFDRPVKADPAQVEFAGPMTRTLRPVDHDRSEAPPLDGGSLELADLPAEAAALVRPGHRIIADHEAGPERRFALLTVRDAQTVPARQALRLHVTVAGDLTGWQAGRTAFRCNTVDVSHGETQGSKTLGSGNGEQARQSFVLAAAEVSFIPSTASGSGVVPDIDVAVNDETWAYGDYTDPDVEGRAAYSTTVEEDGRLRIHFRRRLPTGTDNILLLRHRIGVGAAGNGVPALSFARPMRRHRVVTAVVQPFATSGGADREPVAAIRENASSRLGANDRAVSLADFERLARRHSSVWQARARLVPGPGPAARIAVTIVPAGGGASNPALRQEIGAFIAARALPGTRVGIEDYVPLPVAAAVTLRIDTERFDQARVTEAARDAILAAFSLRRRMLGQPFYVAELLAAAENVVGVETTVVTAFGRAPGAPAAQREATIGGALSVIVPRADQVAHLPGAAALGIAVEKA